MSGTNAIHGIVIVGAMSVAGLGNKDTLTRFGDAKDSIVKLAAAAKAL